METERRRMMKETRKNVTIAPFEDDRTASASMEVWGRKCGVAGRLEKEPCNDYDTDHGSRSPLLDRVRSHAHHQ